MEMSLLEIGAYAKLLAWSWDNGPVPAEDRRRAAILGVSERSLRSIWAGISDKWAETAGGYVNERLERQRTLLEQFKERQSERGRAGADGRWRKHGASIPEASRPPVTQAPPDDGSPISDLRSANPLRQDRSEGHGVLNAKHPRDSGLINGSDQRRHGMHAWCDYQRGLCVPWGLHAEFKARLGVPDAEARLTAWYPTVVARYAGRPIGDDLFAFWRNELASWVGTVTAKPIEARETKGATAVDAFDRADRALEDAHARRTETAPRRPEVVGRGTSSKS